MYIRSNISGEYLAETNDPDEAQRICDSYGSIDMIVNGEIKPFKRAYIEQVRTHEIIRLVIPCEETELEPTVTRMIPLLPWYSRDKKG